MPSGSPASAHVLPDTVSGTHPAAGPPRSVKVRSVEKGHRNREQPSTPNSATSGQLDTMSPHLWCVQLCTGPMAGVGCTRKRHSFCPTRRDHCLVFKTDSWQLIWQLTHAIQSSVQDLKGQPGMEVKVGKTILEDAERELASTW